MFHAVQRDRLDVYLFHTEQRDCLRCLKGLGFLIVILEKLALQFYSESTSVKV